MRVLIVHPGKPIYGGAERVIVKLANHIAEGGDEVAYLTTRLPRDMAKDLKGVGIYEMGNRTSSRLEEVWRLCRGVKAIGHTYDIINYHNFPATLAAMFCDTSSLWMCNEPAELFTSWWRRPIESLNGRIVRNRIGHAVVSDHANAARFKYLYGFEPRVIHYGIDHDFFSQPVEPLQKDGFVMLQVGTLTPWKNQVASLDLMRRLNRSIPATLILVGDDSNEAYVRKLREYMDRYALGRRVRILGDIKRRDLRRLYQSADVLLHPVGQQGGWLAPFEAMSAGLPVLVSPKFTAADIILGENIGSVFGVGFVEELFRHPQPHKEMAERGCEWVRENLTWERYCGQMVEYFREVVEK